MAHLKYIWTLSLIFVCAKATHKFHLESPCKENRFYDAYYNVQTGFYCASPWVTEYSSFHDLDDQEGGCSAHGTLKIALDASMHRRRAVIVDLFFDDPKKFSFDLGDSPSNDGYGQDQGHHEYDAEIHPIGNTGLRIYRNEKSGHSRKSITDAFSKRLTLYVRDGRIEWSSDLQSDFIEGPGLFALNGQTDDAAAGGVPNYDIYLGVNKAVYGRGRKGSGLCRVGIRFTTDTYALYDASYNLKSGIVCDSPFVTVPYVFKGTGCSTRGVLKLALNAIVDGPTRRGVLIDLEFDDNPTGFTWNLGDSVTNNAYGGDNNDTEYNAEVHSWNDNGLRIYRNEHARYRRGRREQYEDLFSKRLTLIAKDGIIQWISETDCKFIASEHLFGLNGQTDDVWTGGVANYDLFLGLNRVIHGHKGRIGSGLCKASIRFLNEDGL